MKDFREYADRLIELAPYVDKEHLTQFIKLTNDGKANKSININSLCMNKYEFEKMINVLEKKLINREYTL